MREIQLILPDRGATEKTGVDTADEITLTGPMVEAFLDECEACGLDPTEEFKKLLIEGLQEERKRMN